MSDNQVCPKRPISKTKLSTAIGAAWGRVANKLGKGSMADRMEVNAKTIDRAMAGPSLPDAENLLNSLIADPSALDEVLKLYGLKVVPNVANAANDMALVTSLSGTVAEYLQRIADGKRCHVDTAVLAELFRPLLPQMQAIVDEHDARRAA